MKPLSAIDFDTIHITKLEDACRAFIKKTTEENDSAHDFSHILRVVANTKLLTKNELNSDPIVTIAAAWLHDCVVLPKDHPDRKITSQLAAKKAEKFLESIRFPKQKIPAVKHVIEAHSYSAGIKPETLEAKIVQDADRLDALGAIGIARCMLVGGALNRPLYNPEDPFCKTREPDDQKWTIDHFWQKLFKLPGRMNTEPAKIEAVKRVRFMRQYLEELENETG